MIMFRSAFNGIGSAAGVTWPLFGITFTLLGGTIGGVLSLALGSVCISLFVAMGLAICFFAYRDMNNTKQQLQNQLQKNEVKLLDDMDNYIACLKKKYTSSSMEVDFNTYLKLKLKEDLLFIQKNGDSPLSQILQLMSDEFDKDNGEINKNNILKRITESISQQPMPIFKMLASAFSSFVGIFGSIAGCSAGFTGLLNGIGVFSSFAAFPVLGWGVLVTAFILGTYAAVGVALGENDVFKQVTLSQKFKEMHKPLEKAILLRNIDIAFHETLHHLTDKPEEKTCIMSQNQSFFPSLFKENQPPDQQNILLGRSGPDPVRPSM